MATGILGTAALTALTNETVYTVPTDTFSVVTVNVTNRSTGSREVRLAIAASDTPANAEYIEYDSEIVAHGVLERSGIVLDAGKKIVAYANSTEVSVQVYGIETATA